MRKLVVAMLAFSMVAASTSSASAGIFDKVRCKLHSLRGCRMCRVEYSCQPPPCVTVCPPPCVTACDPCDPCRPGLGKRVVNLVKRVVHRDRCCHTCGTTVIGPGCTSCGTVVGPEGKLKPVPAPTPAAPPPAAKATGFRLFREDTRF